MCFNTVVNLGVVSIPKHSCMFNSPIFSNRLLRKMCFFGGTAEEAISGATDHVRFQRVLLEQHL